MMKKVIALLLALTMIAALFAGCAQDTESPEESNASDDLSGEPIRIGCIQDTSGGASLAGHPTMGREVRRSVDQ